MIGREPLLTYLSQTDRIYRTSDLGQTDASWIMQVVKPDVGIISRKRSRNLQYDYKLGCVIGNRTLLTYLIQPLCEHGKLEPARIDAINIMRYLAS